MKNLNRLAGGMIRFSFEIALVLALSVLAVISVQYVHGASAPALTGRDDGSRTPVLIELLLQRAVPAALRPMLCWKSSIALSQ
jgi:hypothetical protein